MKKLLFTAMLFTALTAQSQFVDGIPLSDVDVPFLQVWITQKSGSKVFVDYGQEREHLYGINNVMDKYGKELNSLSHVPVITEMINNGYEIISVTALKNETENAILYSFRKK